MNWSKEWITEGMDWHNKMSNPSGIVEFGKDAIATLTIIHGHKEYQVPVTIIGDLALEYDDDGWNIYHVSTLTLFSKAVPGYYPATQEWVDGQECFEYDKQPLLNWMKKVQENYPTAWTMLRCLTPEDFEDKGQSAKDIILKWCLSVPVS